MSGTGIYTDNQLLKEIAKGDESAFRELFDRYMQPLCYFGFQLVRDRDEAKDIAIRAFENLWEQQQQSDTISAAKSYLYTSVKNGCLNYLRHRKIIERANRNLQQEPVTEAEVDAIVVQGELMQMIYAEIQALNPQQRQIILLNIVEGMSVRDIAEKLQISESHVRADRSRAVGYLRASLAKKGMLEISLLFFHLLTRHS